MDLTRVYRNAAGTTIRTDTIIMERRNNTISKDKDEHVFKRDLKTTLVHGPADRVVASFVITGDYVTIETVSGNFTWATWTNPVAILDMSDLPGIGATV